ncbi:SapC [Ruegeria denitrificans]|uniref:SapC n=1 Tax=Ruegeria denitrificans TaxID=1715692 RepID=A0A0P1II65_9RHOB|nr:SapC family protein [Ruegeria denitrificans]CUJ97961.1 SapC [Ruegeria denitrificans]
MAQNGQVPVTFSRHGHKYWTRFTSYKFAANHTECTIVQPEVRQAAASFPILFKQSAWGFEPVVLFSVFPYAPNPFVSLDGRWLAGYVPSELRCFPFLAEPVKQNSADQTPLYQLKVDETSGRLSNDPNHEAFFDGTDTLSPALREVQAFLQARASAQEKTVALCSIINGLGLFEPIATHDGVDLPSNMFGISAQRLKSISAVDKLKLVEFDAFLLIHAHQISLSHCEWLVRAQQQLVQQKTPEKYTESSDISGFLHAVVNAQNDDFLGTSEV